MSTFNGIVHEFPDIAIDFFRPRPGRRSPMACFLSHVHSDHLAGLESLRSPFVYCSSATREILLRLEKYPSRIAYANGIREAPVRTYKHLRALLKPIPLDTPTNLELEPGNRIQVTLLDANHCPGAVMFLIEGNNKAVLYTGDIRSEPWWVNTIARSPSLVEYSSGLKTLDRIYLDTSMLSNHVLQTKAEGLKELLGKVSKYPGDTIFCMQAWTYGYEEIHVDKYKMGVYKSLVAKSTSDPFATQFHHSKEAPFLVGFNCGNSRHEGCLTLEENVRIHSCEKGTSCSVMENKPIVWIRPIVAHLPGGQDIAEVGLGGGGDDLEQEAELRHLAAENLKLLTSKIDEIDTLSAEVREEMKALLIVLVSGGCNESLDLDIDDFSEDVQTRLGSVIWPVVKSLAIPKDQNHQAELSSAVKSLPKRISFPYARHSTYPELKHLVQTFRPRDMWPNTVDISYWVERGITMRSLFGDCCSGSVFEHDLLVQEVAKEQLVDRPQREEEANASGEDSQRTASFLEPSSPLVPSTDPLEPEHEAKVMEEHSPTQYVSSRKSVPAADVISISSSDSSSSTEMDPSEEPQLPSKRSFQVFSENETQNQDPGDDPEMQGDSQASALSARAYETRQRAFRTADENGEGRNWGSINLLSTTDHHSSMDEELGGL
ncbi:hypothetical protein BJ170DRAFT_715874 [Xylariales sp. AK1849]|nr:hypothetical protein BJ170DRAFT_715874 [Xylariales sp. AK1849]